MELTGREGRVALGGIKQRATLGFLLLNANRVVATSRLVEALWPTGAAPVTARKILQNAVWGLRGELSSHGLHTGSVALVTQTPGYMLRVDVDDVDLHVFQQKFAEGRAELVSGSPERAAGILKQALDLWRGPVLSDLVEVGLSWPELATAQKSRLDALEDYFQAELDCGRHRAVLGRLEAQVEEEPLREGFSGQLMTVLYRCGRQAEALNVYGRVRQALVEELGLEPGRGLQELQRAILKQDPSLQLPAPQERRAPAPALSGGSGWGRGEEPVRARNRTAAAGPGPTRPAEPDPTRRAEPASSVLLVRADPVREGGRAAYSERVRGLVAERMHAGVRRFAGRVAEHGEGSWLVVFDGAAGAGPADHAVRAVRAAVAVVEGGAPAGVHLSAAVATAGSGDGVDALAARCQEMLGAASTGRIRVCDRTREATRAEVDYAPGGDGRTGCWSVRRARAARGAGEGTPVGAGGHQPELLFLSGLLDWVRQYRTPHLVTLLWESEDDRDRLLAEFEHCFAQQAWDARILMGRAFAASRSDPAGSLPAACLGALPGCGTSCSAAPTGTMDIERLVRTFSAQPGQEGAPGATRASTQEPWGMLRYFLLGAAHDRPLVTVFDDLHHAADPLLEFVEELGEGPSSVPLLVIAVAHAKLLRDRPGWGGGANRFTTLTIDTARGAGAGLPRPPLTVPSFGA
ncbi:BTAD domain-containing putative transcriptional regulator [Nocardiopsis sp. NPDC058631]|uniref:AfsR/SARP family transcriptional regulator n=1 Tax=Nocardiopsis sp. NPDC058631 TaxID=3346566 RepID=UPI00364B4A06